MPTAIDNVRNGLTITGLDYFKVPALLEAQLDVLLEYGHDEFFDYLMRAFHGKDDAIDRLILEMAEFQFPGEFIDSSDQRTELAAYGLVAADRLTAAGRAGIDGWRCFPHWLHFSECLEYVHGNKNAARKAAMARHAEHRAMRAEVIAYYTANAERFKSIDAAATEIARTIVPVTFRTVRDWIAKHRKDERSARRP